MAKRKFFKTVVTVTILSQDEPVGDGLDLEALHYEITDGDCSGQIGPAFVSEITAVEMAELLTKQDSDPSFFGLDTDGSDFSEDMG